MPPDKKGPLRWRAAGPVNGDHADELIEPTSSKTPAKTQQRRDEAPLGQAAAAQALISAWRSRYRVHPAADVFPEMSDEELAELGEDIKKHGLRHRIIFHGFATEMDSAQVIDGRNRLEAMQRAGVEIKPERDFHVASFHDVRERIISLNVHRRHLTKEQRARMIIAETIATDGEGFSKGGRGKVNEVRAKIVAKAAKEKISKRTVERAFERATDHPNAPKSLRQKAARQRSKAAAASRMAPTTVDGWRRGYLHACKVGAPDLDAEMTMVVDGLQEIAGMRANAAVARGQA